MIVSIIDKSSDRRHSGETAVTESSSTRTVGGSFGNKVNKETTMTRQRSVGVQVMAETDEETSTSSVPPESMNFTVGSESQGSVSAEKAAMAAHAILNGKSISEIYDEDSLSNIGMNDSGSQSSELKEPSMNPGQFDSIRSTSTDSALSEQVVHSDRLQESHRRSYPSSVRILRSPNGQRVKRKIPAKSTTHSFRGCCYDDGSSDSPKSSSSKFSATSAERGGPRSGPLSSPLSGSERPSVKILRSSNGKRLKRKVAAGYTGPLLRLDLSGRLSPSSSLRSESSRLFHHQLPDDTGTQQIPEDAVDAEKEVAFGSVRVRYYERVVDINPACSSGVAIGLGWKYQKSKRISVDEYELQKGGVRYHARQLFLPRSVREDIAREFGYTQRDIAKGTRANLKLRNERKQTIDNLGMMGIEEKAEACARKIEKLLCCRNARRSNKALR